MREEHEADDGMLMMRSDMGRGTLSYEKVELG